MSRQSLRDRQGRLIGFIDDKPGGILEIRDHQGRMKGKYDPKRNITYDHIGRNVGTGNLLTMLLDD